MASASQIDCNTYCAFCGVHFTRQSLGRESMISEPLESREDSTPCEHCRQGIKPGHSITCYSKYSPELLSSTSLSWLRRFHILQIEPEVDGTNKVIIASLWDAIGRAEGYFMVRNDFGLWQDAYKPTSYYQTPNGSIRAFPFHWCCYALFANVLTGDEDSEKVDSEILFRTMQGLTKPFVQALSLNYGDLCPELRRKDGNWERREQFWESLPGEELFVSHPNSNSGVLEDFLRTRISTDYFQKSAALYLIQHIERKVLYDPFGRLPHELLETIGSWLDPESLIALNKASLRVFFAFYENNGFWKRQVLRSMPWLFEMRNILKDADMTRGRDCKGLFLWLEETTKARLFVKKPFLGVANRRRIWKVCEEIAGHYRAMEAATLEGRQ